jgi:hypothetical protein
MLSFDVELLLQTYGAVEISVHEFSKLNIILLFFSFCYMLVRLEHAGDIISFSELISWRKRVTFSPRRMLSHYAFMFVLSRKLFFFTTVNPRVCPDL